MKLIWKGKFTSKEQLSLGVLPPDAVKFREPNGMLMLNLIASLFVMPVMAVIFCAAIIKQILAESVDYNLFSIWGLILAIVMIFPHEWLHAIMFPKKAEVEVWYSIKNMVAFVFSTYPLTKRRFIMLSLLPNIVFGFLPLLIWIFVPFEYKTATRILFSFSATSLLFGVGDFMNVFNASTQMPKGSVTQLSGFNSYWFFADK